jgi:hypothetical protein
VPTIARDGEFRFVIHTRELPFEPPHVHVSFGDDEIRIELVSGMFMEHPPEGKRRPLLEAFRRHADLIRKTWEDIHGPLPGGGTEP